MTTFVHGAFNFENQHPILWITSDKRQQPLVWECFVCPEILLIHSMRKACRTTIWSLGWKSQSLLGLEGDVVSQLDDYI